MGISFLTILVFYLPSDSGEKVSKYLTTSGFDKHCPKLLEKSLNVIHTLGPGIQMMDPFGCFLPISIGFGYMKLQKLQWC
jgi:hypothetical protein